MNKTPFYKIKMLKKISEYDFLELMIFCDITIFWQIIINACEMGGSNKTENIIAHGAFSELLKYEFIQKKSKSKYQMTNKDIEYLNSNFCKKIHHESFKKHFNYLYYRYNIFMWSKFDRMFFSDNEVEEQK